MNIGAGQRGRGGVRGDHDVESSLTVPPLSSLAVTSTDTVPVSAVAGVPAKVRVLSVKVSHVGSVEPSAFVAA